MRKLLQINVCVNQGSTGRIAEQIGAAAVGRGWESYIAFGRGAGNTASQAIKVGNIVDFYSHALLTRLTDNHGRYSRIATRQLIRRIKEISPDIIHLHNIHGYYINYKILFDYLGKADIPVVWTLHDCWTMTGHCSHFEFAKCNKWKSGCHDCPEKGSYPKSILLDRSRKNYVEKREIFNSVKNLTIVPVSNWLGEVAKESYLKRYNVEVIHNGIDIQTFKPLENNLKEQYGIADKTVILGVAAPWGQRKGFDDFVKLSAILPKERYQVVMIGLSEAQIERLPEGIIGLARTNSVEELAQWYSAADVFVNPTYEDSFPTTILEALSCGTPVVTYQTGGSPESITDDTGRVVAKGDIEGVVSAIEELCAVERADLQKRCREYALAHFDKNECFKKYVDLYENIINNI